MPIQLSGSGSITGVSTLRSLASLDVTGSVSVGGTLIYDDVTNIDSVGIVTARSDVHVGAGLSVTGISTFNNYLDINGNIDVDASRFTYDASTNQLKLADDVQLRFGDGSDLRIYHSGTDGNSYIQDAGPGGLKLTGSDIHLKNVSDHDMIHAQSGGYVKLYHNNNQRLETAAFGISVTGGVNATGVITATSFSGSGASLDDVLTSTRLQHSIEYPSIRPTLDLNFAATKTLDRRITFTRDGVGTYVDDMGIIKYASNNTPRFDHDPTTGESLGLLIEESRTNQMIYSSDITGDTAQNGTITGDATTAPDGTTTADKYAANSTNGIHRVDMPFTSGQITNSTAYTFSVFVKANGYDKLHIRYAGYNADNHGLGYDLSDGTTFAGKFDGTGALGAVTSSSMIEYPNGWYRCSFTVTTASDAASGVAYILYYVSNSEATTNFAGDGISGMYFWGAQMEEGDFPTSYIPTSGTTVTRAADFAAIRRTNFTDFYNSDEGTIYCEFTHGTRPWHFCDADTSQSQRFFGFSDNSGGIRVGRNASGWTYLSAPTTGSYSRGDNIKSAVSYGPTSFSVGAFGQVADSGTTNANTGIDRLLFYQDTSNPDTNGTIRALKYYNKRLTNTQLQGLTQQ